MSPVSTSAPAVAAAAPPPADLIVDAGNTYTMPELDAIAKYTPALCAKLMTELVDKGLIKEGSVAGFDKMAVVDKREALIKIIKSFGAPADEAAAESANEGAEAAAPTNGSGKAVESPATATVEAPVSEAKTEPVKADTKAAKPSAEKKAAATNKEKVKAAAAASGDQVALFSQKVEKIKTRAELETLVRDIVEADGFNEFALGGAISRAQANPEWWTDTYPKFKDYLTQVLDVEYRKAMYCVKLYNSLLKLDIPWSAFGDIGWTKVLVLVDVVTKETVSDWVEKAKLLTVEALKEVVKAAQAPEGTEEKPKPATVSMAFKLHPDQKVVVDNAIEQALKKTGSENKSVALEAMAQDYMGSGLNFANWVTALVYARKQADDPQAFAAAVITKLEDLCPEIKWPEINLDLKTVEDAA